MIKLPAFLCNNKENESCYTDIGVDDYKKKFHINEPDLNLTEDDMNKLLKRIKSGELTLQLGKLKTTVTEKALEHALDIRKFEIELYWKRATYFWTFIGATLAAFLAVYASSSLTKPIQQDLSVLLSCLGLVFSFAWVLVNRGSKFWQENWEQHVDALEDNLTGPLYKTIMPKKESHWLVNSSQISVSKINQLVSVYISLLWFTLLINTLYPNFSLENDVNYLHLTLVLMSFFICLTFLCLGKSSSANYLTTKIKQRKSFDSKEEYKQL